MGAKWKREKVQDHKFDYINVDDFVDNSCWRQFTYSFVFLAIIRGILVYCSDIFTAVNLLANADANFFVSKNGLDIEGLFKLPYDVYKYLFAGCIILGFLLLGLEIRRSRNIIQSRDISYAFTSLMASRYYTVRSYPHYCFFAQINNSKKMVDDVAFFCFFTFRSWKRLMLADAPRQVINATILYQVFKGHFHFNVSQPGWFFDWNFIIKDDKATASNIIFKKISVGAMMFTVSMFAFSLISLVAAVFMYVPLVIKIQGNLKEYCCFIIDKRIDELIRKNTKSRALAAQTGTSKGNKDIAMGPMKQPTLPQLDLLEAPKAHTKSPYSGGHDGYDDHGYNNGYSNYNNSNNQGYSNSNNQGYNQAYPKDDYFQPKPPKKDFDPYAESAFTSEDIYDHYGNNQDQQYLQQSPSGNDAYDYATPGSGTTFYSGSTAVNTPTPRTRRYDDYAHQRPGSPMQSQHGSDLSSNHNGSGHGYSGYGHSNSNVNINNNNNTGYGNDYTSGAVASPQRGRRQDTAQSRDRYRAGGNGGY